MRLIRVPVGVAVLAALLPVVAVSATAALVVGAAVWGWEAGQRLMEWLE